MRELPRPLPTAPPLATETGLLAYALTGEELTLGEGDLAGELAAQGWDTERLQALRRSRQKAGQPWPFPVVPDQIRSIGFARFDALVAAARRELHLDGLVPRLPADRPMDADERRLSADRPPHW